MSMKLGLISALMLALVACNDDDFEVVPEGGAQPTPGAPGAPGSETPAPGTTPPGSSPQPPSASAPKVISSMPEAYAKGVKEDATIVLKFDRAMDMPSVEGAYVSLELPKDKVTFKWSAAHDEVTIVPAEKLKYAAGAANVGANGYAIKIQKSAKAEAGIAMSDDYSLAFSSLRRITEKPARIANLSGRVSANGNSTGLSCGVGDFYTAGGGGSEVQMRGFLTFDLGGLPDVEIEKATLSVPEDSITGTPDASLGTFSGAQVFYTNLGMDAFNAEPVSGLTFTRLIGLLGNPSVRRADATAMVKDDLANRAVRNNRTQLRMSYATATNSDATTDSLYLDLPNATLSVTYLAP